MHVRCPNCHNPLELSDDIALSDIPCPTCGSSFSLVDDETVTRATERTIVGHFELIRRLGVGAFGSVWQARDRDLDRTVAVKIPRKEELDPAETEKFLREARAAAQLKHPNIVSVHEVGREGGRTYIVSDYVRGVTLSDRLSTGPLGIREAAELCARIANALHHAHESGVIHRDLKPSNVMLDDNAEPHVMDFGLAKRDAGEVTMTLDGEVIGTPAYMSPEQALGDAHRADRRSDVYSLGVILFECLTGERPFRGNQRMLLQQVINAEPPSPRILNNQIPRDLETICLKCLQKSPERRYITASELADDIRRYLKGEPIVARPITAVGRAVRWVRRKPLVAALALMVFVVLLAAVTLPLQYSHQRTLEVTNDELSQAVTREEGLRKQLEGSYATEEVLRREAERSRDELDRLLAARRVSLADGLIKQNRPDAAIRILNEVPERHRVWEWHYINKLCLPHFLELDAHREAIGCAFSPDNRFIVTVGNVHEPRKEDPDSKFANLKGVALLWDASTGEKLCELERGEETNSTIRCVAYSPAGNLIATGGGQVWDAEKRTPICTLEGCKFPRSISFNQDASLVAAGDMVWDARSGRVVHQFGEETSCVLFGPFQDTVIRVQRRDKYAQIVLTDLTTKTDVVSRDFPEQISVVAVSPDGRHIGLVTPIPGVQRTIRKDQQYDEIHIWDLATNETRSTAGRHHGGTYCLAFSHDGRTLVSGGRFAIKVWDCATGEEKNSFVAARAVQGITISPDDTIVAAAMSRWIRLYDLHSAPHSTDIVTHDGEVGRIATSPRPDYVCTVGDHVRVWDPKSGAPHYVLPDSITWSAAFSHDGKQLATVSRAGIVISDADSGSVVRQQKVDAPLVVFGLAYSPAGDRLAACVRSTDDIKKGHLGRIILQHLSDPSDQIEIPIPDTQPESKSQTTLNFPHLTCLAFNHDGSQVGICIWGACIRTWDCATGREVLVLDSKSLDVGGGMAFAFDPAGKYLAVAYWQGIRLFRADGSTVYTVLSHSDLVTAIAFMPDGSRIITASNDGELKIWDTETGIENIALTGHAGRIQALTFVPHVECILSGDFNGVVKKWSIRAVSAPAL